jgi:mutator protein MutT
MEPKKIKPMTLCMVHQGNKILLGMKKRGFGAGQWNGFGGKLNEGESMHDAALREIQEEVGITPQDLDERGVLTFEFEQDPKVLEVHIFSVTKFSGEPVETEEMKPQWFDTDKIPFEQMWSDDQYWLPLFLQGKKFKGTFLFDKPSTPEYSAKILNQQLEEVK